MKPQPTLAGGIMKINESRISQIATQISKIGRQTVKAPDIRQKR
jgi:hypothetical protein